MCSRTCWLWGKETTCSEKIKLIINTVLVLLTVPKQTWVSSLMGYLTQHMSTKDNVWKKSHWQSCHLYSTPVSRLCTCWTQRLFLANRTCFKTTSLPAVWSRRPLVSDLINKVCLGTWEWDLPQSGKRMRVLLMFLCSVYSQEDTASWEIHVLYTHAMQTMSWFMSVK